MTLDASVLRPTGDGQWEGGLLTPAATGWSVKTYLLVTISIVFMAALGVGVGAILGEPATGAIVAALPAALLVAAWPEIGVFLLVVYVPIESYGTMGSATATVTKVMAAYTGLVLLIHLLGGRRGNMGVGALWLAIAYAAWSGLAMIGTRLPELAASVVVTRILLIGLMFIVLNACATRERFQALCWTLFLAAVAAAILSFFLTPKQESARLTIEGINVNEHAQNLMGGAFMIPLLLGWSRPAGRLLVGLGSLVLLAGLVLTGSRSVWLALVAGLLVAGLLYRGTSISRRVMWVLGTVVLLGTLVAVGFVSGIFGELVVGRVREGWEQGLTAGSRASAWMAALRMGADHPLMGIGPGQYFLEASQYNVKMMMAPHNIFLNTFAEAGVPGLLLITAFMVAVFKKAWRVAQPGLRAVLLGLFAAALVTNLANPYYQTKGYWFHMSLCVLGGMLFATRSQQEPGPSGG